MAKRGSDPEEGGRGTQRRDDRAVYIISVAAELAGMHPQTLRIYERRGLVRPSRTAGNTRRYSDRDIARLQKIQQLTQEQGINLAGVKMIVEMERQLEQMREAVRDLERELERTRKRMREALDRAASAGEIVPLRSILLFPWQEVSS